MREETVQSAVIISSSNMSKKKKKVNSLTDKIQLICQDCK